MKLNSLFTDFRPQFKCFDPVSLLAFASIFNGVVQAASSSSNVDSQLAAQARENQKNRDWNTQEAEKARQFQNSERLSAQNFFESVC